MRKNDHIALVSRCKLVHMTTSHKNGEEFPYTIEELALYMFNYLNSKNAFTEAQTETFCSDNEEVENPR